MPTRSPRPLSRRIWNLIAFTRLRLTLATGITMAVIALLSVGAATWNMRMDQCGSGVYHEGPLGECVGVTDGSFTFATALFSVEDAIHQENLRLDSPYVTIALLVPMTDPDPAAQAEILHEVRGAYAAQYRANHSDNKKTPLIRLILANPGVNSAQWSAVVGQLKSMTGAPDNLRAVVGISVSTDITKAEVARLTRQDHIPVVGGAISANDIANPVTANVTSAPLFPGLARVSPTNSQAAAALAEQVDPRQTVLVEDTRLHDDYISSLRTAFLKASQSAVSAYQFQSPPDISQVGDTANTFANYVVPNICVMRPRPRYIYFAGRQAQLAAFINALADGPCGYARFTILTGSAGSHLASGHRLEPDAFSRGITLEYAAIASPDAWTGPRLPPTGGSRHDYQAFTSALTQSGQAQGDPAALADGEAIINYDATWTAISAIRQVTTTSSQLPSLTNIANEWTDLNGLNKVRGASGWICLDSAGNPYDKAIPLVLYAGGDKPVFYKNAWPQGHPPDASCRLPTGR